MPSPNSLQQYESRKKGSFIPREYQPKRYGRGKPSSPVPLGRAHGLIGRLSSDTIQTIGWPNRDYSLIECEDALKSNITLGAVQELKALRAGLTFGAYTYHDKRIQDWVRGVLEGMETSLSDIASRSAIASYYGFWAGEIVWTAHEPGHRGEWRVKAIDPLDLTKVRFMGSKYGLTGIEYNTSRGVQIIPLDRNNPFRNKAIHLCSGNLDIRNDPYGIGMAIRAIPYVKAINLLMTEWIVAGRNQAQGLLVGQADSNKTVQLVGANGKPLSENNGRPQTMSAVHQLKRELEQIDGLGFLVTDLENRIQHQPWSIDGQFYDSAITRVHRMLLMSQVAPTLLLEEGMSSSLGTAGVAEQSRLTLDAIIRNLNSRLQTAIIQSVIRPMLIANFGITTKQGFGQFEIDSEADPNHASTVVNNIISAVTANLISATDLNTINRVRKMLGLPPQTTFEMLEEIRQSIVVDNLRFGQGNIDDLLPPEMRGGGESLEEVGQSYPPE